MNTKTSTPRNKTNNPKLNKQLHTPSKSDAHILENPKTPKRAIARKAPAQKRSHNTVEVILIAAKALFVELGYSGTTTNKIAVRAGVSIGSLYQYFPDKAAILMKLFQMQLKDRMPQLEEAVRDLAIPNIDIQEQLRTLIEKVVFMHEMSPKLRTILFAEAKRTPQLREMITEAEAHQISLTADVLKQIPQTRSGNYQLMATFIVHTTEAIAHWIVNHATEEKERKEALDEAVQLIYRFMVC